MEVQETRIQTDRVLTIPNILSMARLAGVPLFLWLILRPVFDGNNSDGWALLVLMLSGISDYLDGKLARRWNQISRLGRLLDPAADRLYILSTLVGLTWREILPLWLTAALLARELMLLVMVVILRRHGYPPPQVNFLGKAATFNLMYAFPLLLLSDGSGWLATLGAVFGWAFAGWGTTLYWWAGILYVVQVRRLVKARSVVGPRMMSLMLPLRAKSAEPSSLQGGRFRHEGRRDGWWRRHTSSPHDLKHAQAAPARGQSANHGACAAVAQTARSQ